VIIWTALKSGKGIKVHNGGHKRRAGVIRVSSSALLCVQHNNLD